MLINFPGWLNKKNLKDIIITPEDNLQNKQHRYYHKELSKLTRGEVYLSKFDLNIENGKIEDPIKPTIRVGMPLYAKDKDIQYGYLILNYDGKNLVSSIKDLFLDRQSDILIANSNFD